MATKVLYDAFGHEIRLTEKPPKEPAARVGHSRDPWAGKNAGEITPDVAAQVLRGDADLGRQMAVAKRLLLDPHIFTCIRNLVYSVSRLPWEVLPFDAKSRAAAKQADEIRAWIQSLRFLKKLQRQLLFGEHYPFVGQALPWNSDYTLDNFIRINPVRWRWDDATNLPRLLTASAPTQGVSIEGERRGYVLYMAELEPAGSPREAGLWRKALWLWMFSSWTWAAWVRFAEAYGDPYIWAFFARKEDEDSVFNAVMGMDRGARGVFPVGTEIKLQEAQRYGTTALYQAIIEQARAGITQLYLGHTLNTEAQSGSGTLAGNAAADISQANKEGVADNLEETTQEDLVLPRCAWTIGEQAVLSGEIPRYRIKADPPADLVKKASVYVSVNEGLAAVGRAIDPEQYEEEFAVRTVERVAAAPIAGEDGEEPPQQRAAASQRVRAADRAPRIATAEDVEAASVRLARNAAEEFTARVSEAFEAAETIEEGIDALWEGYRAMDATRLASAMRDATLAAEAIGRGEVE